MPPSARRFLCARCRAAVILCRTCDRGQRYCDEGCAPAARAERQREAAARYRATRRARFDNAERQKRHRARRGEKVTHQCSPPGLDAGQRLGLWSWLVAALGALIDAEAVPSEGARRCDRCRALVGPALRAHFLRRADRWRPKARAP